MSKLNELQAKREELAAGIKAHADLPEESHGTPEWQAKWDALNKDYDTHMADLTAEKSRVEAEAKQREAVEARLSEVGSYQNYQPAARTPRFGRDGGTIEQGPVNRAAYANGGAASDIELQGMALHGWMLSANSSLRNRVTDQHRAAAHAVGVDLSGNEFTLRLAASDRFSDIRNQWHERQIRNSMQSGNPATGGALVGETLLTSIEMAQLDFSGVLQVADVIRTDTGEPFYWPTFDDTANTGTRVGESGDAGTASDPVTGRVMWHSFPFTSGLLNVSRTLLRDSFTMVEQVIGNALGQRLGRKQNTDYTTGFGGGNAPRGIVTAATLGVTTASATATAWDEIIDLEHSVDPSRRQGPKVGYMLHDTILKSYRKLKDGEGRYLWASGANAGVPDTLNARPYWINQAMASSMTSGAKTLLFGDMSQYKVRQVGAITIQRLVERRAEYAEDVFIAYLYGDGNLLDAGDHPIKYLGH